MGWRRRLIRAIFGIGLGVAVFPVHVVVFEHFGIDATGPQTGMASLPLLLVLAWPIASEWFRDGKEWTTLDEPLRSQFRSIAVRYLVALWVLSGAGLVVLISYATRRLGFSFAIGALATLLVLIGAATLVAKHRMRAIRTSAEHSDAEA